MENLERQIAQHFKIKYTQHLNEYQVHCPYHNDKHKSASLNFRKQVFYCFTCNLGKTFQQVYDEKINTMDKKLSLDINAFGKKELKQLDFVTELTNLLQTQTKVSRILKELPQQELQQYAIDSIKNKGIPLEILDTINAVPIFDINDPHYGYIKFPTDNNGHFVARKFLPDDILIGERYLLSSGSRPLVGDISDKFEEYILVEGYLDYLSLKYLLGYDNVVCNLSTAFNKERAYRLKGKVVFILFDNDYPGFKATDDAYIALKQVKAYPIRLDMPEKFGKDPNDAIKDHKDEFAEWLAYYIKQSSATDTNYIKDFGNEKKLYTLKSGIHIIDSEIFQGGFSVGLHAIAAKPTVGKTALGLHLADNIVTLNQNAKVLYNTYEVPKQQCWARLASRYDTEHSFAEIEKTPSIITPYAKERMIELSDKIRIVYGWDISEIARAAGNYDAIFVDYIQVMPGDNLDALTNVSRNIKALSRIMMDKEKVIIVISSIPRSAYEKEDLSVFKESGDIEYAIQSGMLLNPLSQASEERIIKVNVLKNTRGPIGGSFWLKYFTRHNKFEECIPEI